MCSSVRLREAFGYSALTTLRALIESLYVAGPAIDPKTMAIAQRSVDGEISIDELDGCDRSAVDGRVVARAGGTRTPREQGDCCQVAAGRPRRCRRGRKTEPAMPRIEGDKSQFDKRQLNFGCHGVYNGPVGDSTCFPGPAATTVASTRFFIGNRIGIQLNIQGNAAK
jgi:hypothetical protein